MNNKKYLEAIVFFGAFLIVFNFSNLLSFIGINVFQIDSILRKMISFFSVIGLSISFVLYRIGGKK